LTASLRRLGTVFIGVFLVALGIQVAPETVKTAVATASMVVFLVWLFGYVDIKEILEGKKPEAEAKPE
jgi:Kef-type K+ transport system membrane component KefB